MPNKKYGNSKAKAERVDALTMKTRSRAASRNKAKEAMPGNLAVARALNTIIRSLGANQTENARMRSVNMRHASAVATNITQGEQAKKTGGNTARSGMALQRARNRANSPTKTERKKTDARIGRTAPLSSGKLKKK